MYTFTYIYDYFIINLIDLFHKSEHLVKNMSLLQTYNREVRNSQFSNTTNWSPLTREWNSLKHTYVIYHIYSFTAKSFIFKINLYQKFKTK